MDLEEKKLYHQLHPVKLLTDVGVTPFFLAELWRHQVVAALVVGFVPPVCVTLWMMRWPPNLERIRDSAAGAYLRKYMTPSVEAARLLTLLPMAYGAWVHAVSPIALGCGLLALAWGYGPLFRR